jgi:hypothetical protein
MRLISQDGYFLRPETLENLLSVIKSYYEYGNSLTTSSALTPPVAANSPAPGANLIESSPVTGKSLAPKKGSKATKKTKEGIQKTSKRAKPKSKVSEQDSESIPASIPSEPVKPAEVNAKPHEDIVLAAASPKLELDSCKSNVYSEISQNQYLSKPATSTDEMWDRAFAFLTDENSSSSIYFLKQFL